VLGLDIGVTDRDHVQLVAADATIENLLFTRFGVETPGGAHFHQRDRQGKFVLPDAQHRLGFAFIVDLVAGVVFSGQPLPSVIVGDRIARVDQFCPAGPEDLQQFRLLLVAPRRRESRGGLFGGGEGLLGRLRRANGE
jgi:hypothetical protein